MMDFEFSSKRDILYKFNLEHYIFPDLSHKGYLLRPFFKNDKYPYPFGDFEEIDSYAVHSTSDIVKSNKKLSRIIEVTSSYISDENAEIYDPLFYSLLHIDEGLLHEYLNLFCQYITIQLYKIFPCKASLNDRENSIEFSIPFSRVRPMIGLNAVINSFDTIQEFLNYITKKLVLYNESAILISKDHPIKAIHKKGESGFNYYFDYHNYSPTLNKLELKLPSYKDTILYSVNNSNVIKFSVNKPSNGEILGVLNIGDFQLFKKFIKDNFPELYNTKKRELQYDKKVIKYLFSIEFEEDYYDFLKKRYPDIKNKKNICSNCGEKIIKSSKEYYKCIDCESTICSNCEEYHNCLIHKG